MKLYGWATLLAALSPFAGALWYFTHIGDMQIIENLGFTFYIVFCWTIVPYVFARCRDLQKRIDKEEKDMKIKSIIDK